MSRPSRKNELLDTARDLVMRKGFSATSVDEICTLSQMTKGAFFHHFSDKEGFGLALLDHFEQEGRLRMQAHLPLRKRSARGQLHAYLDLLGDMYGEDARFREGCLFAILAYESSDPTSPLRRACAAALERWMEGARAQFAQIIALLDAPPPVRAEDLAEHLLVVIEGALVMGRVRDPAVAIARALAQFRSYAEAALGLGGR